MTIAPYRALNLNDYVRVKLTEVGLEEYRRQHRELNERIGLRARQFPTEPTLDADGFYVTQLWSLMRDFGHLCGLGMRVPFETMMEVRDA